MIKVVKFGGSSLASAEQFKKVGDIIHADEARRFVVPSAPGKRFSKDIKVTDMLYGCYDLAAKGKDFENEFKAIKDRYYGIINELGLDLSLENEFETIKACFIGKAGSMIEKYEKMLQECRVGRMIGQIEIEEISGIVNQNQVDVEDYYSSYMANWFAYEEAGEEC